MLQLIAEYWLTWVLGLIAAGLGFACKKMYKLYQNEKNYQKTEEQEEFLDKMKDLLEQYTQESKQEDLALQAQINTMQDQINTMQSGILSIQGENFKKKCRELLKPDREINLREFEHLQTEHEIYKGLGGNSDGDFLFVTVQEKVTNSLSNAKKQGT